MTHFRKSLVQKCIIGGADIKRQRVESAALSEQSSIKRRYLCSCKNYSSQWAERHFAIS